MIRTGPRQLGVPRYNDTVSPSVVFLELNPMSALGPKALEPVALSREGADRLTIGWKDGHRSVYTWSHLREQCPCAGCREERLQPPDPFRILKSNELVPLAPVAVTPIGHYAYKITWS